jgi:hypothetical protein
MRVQLGSTGLAVAGSTTHCLFDLGVGASGSEQVLAGDIAIGGCLPFGAWWLPIAVGQGSRIALRIRTTITGKSCTMGVSLYGGGGGVEGGYKGVTYGAVTAASRGTILTAPGATHTEGGWVQLTAATTSRAGWLVVGVSHPDTSIAAAVNGLLDIGVGGAGAEVPIINDIPFAVTANEDINAPYPLTYPVNVPAGSRLVARYRGTSIAAASLISVTVTGIN